MDKQSTEVSKEEDMQTTGVAPENALDEVISNNSDKDKEEKDKALLLLIFMVLMKNMKETSKMQNARCKMHKIQNVKCQIQNAKCAM